MLRTNTQTDKISDFLERRSVHSIWLAKFFVRSISIVWHTKLLSHDLNAFWCVRLPSCDAKSMLNVATFLKMAVLCISRELKFTFGTYTFVYLNYFDYNVSDLRELEPA